MDVLAGKLPVLGMLQQYLFASVLLQHLLCFIHSFSNDTGKIYKRPRKFAQEAVYFPEEAVYYLLHMPHGSLPIFLAVSIETFSIE